MNDAAPTDAGAVTAAADAATTLTQLDDAVTFCRACPRLVAWREQVATERRAAFRDEEYWGRPVPGFGPADARVVVLGLAPAAHGANRTGRVFTGDRSGDWLFSALHRAGLANQPSVIEINQPADAHGPHADQPSLVYSVEIDNAWPKTFQLLDIVGYPKRDDVDGKEAWSLYYVDDDFGSALDLIDSVLLTIERSAP